MPKGVYKKTKEHIVKVVGNLKPGYGKGMKFPERSGKNHRLWKGDKANYFTIHSWLHRHYGKANKCEGLNCKKISKRFQWALIKGKSYIHKRENFKMLCASCHALYDEFKGSPPGTHKGNTYRRLNLIGQRFGKLVVVSLEGKNKWGNLKFLCKCDCGDTSVIASGNLRGGGTTSCGCMNSRNFMKGNKFRQGKIPWNKKVR